MATRTLIVFLAAGTLLLGCGKEEKPADTTSAPLGDTLKEAAGDAGQAAEDAVEEVKGDLAGQFEELKAKAVAEAEDRLTALEGELKGLQVKLDGASDAVKATAQPLFDAANQKFAAVSPKIDALKGAGADAWEAAGKELTSAIDAFEQALDAVASKLGG